MIIVMLIFMLSILPITSNAETIREHTLTISAGLPGYRFQLYQVTKESFGNYQVDLEELDSNGWKTAAATLDAYAKRDQIPADYELQTDDNGEYTLHNLSSGLYLLSGETSLIDSYKYVPTPVLIMLPMQNESKINVKFDQISLEGNTQCEYHVIKIWKDQKNADRPGSVTVQLLKDETVAEEVVLNKENSWRYTWYDLDPKALWTVVEKEVPDGYTVSIDRTQNQYIITNTLDSDEIIPKESGTGDKKLPQTGMLMWPVLILALTGILCIVIGTAKLKEQTMPEE